MYGMVFVEISKMKVGGKHLFQVKYEGNVVERTENDQPKTFNNVKVYAFESGRVGARGSIRNLVYESEY